MFDPYYDSANQPNNEIMKPLIFCIILVAIPIIPVKFVNAEPTITNTHFSIERTFTTNFQPSSMAFVGQDDILVLNRDEGNWQSDFLMFQTEFLCLSWPLQQH